MEGWLAPDWPAPARVRAAVSTRLVPGASAAPFERFNLGARNGDDPQAVAANRAATVGMLGLPHAPHWLHQVHGVDVAEVDLPGVSLSPAVPDAPAAPGEPTAVEAVAAEPCADAAVSRRAGEPLAILTADCLPALFCTRDGGAVGAAHAGWRGLAGGVLEATVAALRAPGGELLAWLGPCIGAASYEVGEEVRAAFVDADAGAAGGFAPTRPGHWLCDLAWLARRRLEALGVEVHGGGFDTRTDARFYSWRRDGAASGRFASLVWIAPAPSRR